MYAGTIDTIDPELQNPSMTTCMQVLLVQVILSGKTPSKVKKFGKRYWEETKKLAAQETMSLI